MYIFIYIYICADISEAVGRFEESLDSADLGASRIRGVGFRASGLGFRV